MQINLFSSISYKCYFILNTVTNRSCIILFFSTPPSYFVLYNNGSSMLHNYCTKWLKVPHPNMIRMTSGCLRFTHIYSHWYMYLIFMRATHWKRSTYIITSVAIPPKFCFLPFLFLAMFQNRIQLHFSLRLQFFVSIEII